jgi:GDSL-like Lipase/Acylhydrolase family
LLAAMKRIALRLALAAFCVLLSLVVAEALLRAFGIQPTEARLDIYRFDEVLGWVTQKNKVFYRSSPFFVGHFSYYNAEGLPTSRDDFDEPPDFKSPSVVLVGDSFVESYYVPYDRSFPFLLSRSITGRRVVNLGVSGYGPEQYLLRARAEAPKYNVSDVVVVFYAANDVPYMDELKYEGGYAKPVFGDTFDRPTNVPLPAPHEGTTKRWLRRRLLQTSMYRVLVPFIGRWTAGQWVVRRKDLFLDPAQFDKAVAMMAAGRPLAPEGRYHIVYMPAREECLDREVLEHNLALFRSSCARIDVACHVAPFAEMAPDAVPSQYIPGDAHLSFAGSATMARFLEGVLARPAP